MNKYFIFILLLVLIITFLTGCWNYREIDKLALVSGIAIDKNNSDGNYEITAEIMKISPSIKESKFDSLKIQSTGKGIFDCMRNMINVSAKQLFWSHASILVVSEDVAKDGILPILDWIVRDTEPRLTLYIVVSKEHNAKEILDLKSLSTEIRSFEIEDMIISNNKLSKVPNVQVHELVNDVSATGFYSVLPTVQMVLNEDKETMALSGGAILNRDKLVGYMDVEDVKYYLFVRNKIKGGLLTTSLTDNNSIDNVTLEIFKNKTKVNPVISNGELSMNIKIKTEVYIGESTTSIDALSKANIQHLKHAAERSLEKDILRVINKIQNDFGLDVFGFGRIVKEKMPNLWKDIDGNWDEIFKDLKVNIDVDINIRGSGHLSKTIKTY